MAKVQIKSEKFTTFGGIFSIMEQFDTLLLNVIDSTLGKRCKSFGYSYSEILRSLMCVFFCVGSYIEDVSTHLMRHLSSHPKIRTCSVDTIIRAIKELTTSNITYTSPVSGKSYDFNTADKMNELPVRSLISTGELRKGQMYDLDFDHQSIETEKYDAKRHIRSLRDTVRECLSSVTILSALRIVTVIQMSVSISRIHLKESLPEWEITVSV